MSIQSEITRIAGNIADSLDAVAAKGVTVPAGSNSDDLPGLIALIQQDGGSAIVVTEEPDTNGGTKKIITAVDLDGDTVTAEHLQTGYTAHDQFGTAITGTYSGPPYNWMGFTPEFVKTLGTVNWTLDDTDWGSYTPKTSSSTSIKATTTLTTFTPDLTSYDYIIRWHCHIICAYQNGAANTAKFLGHYQTIAAYVFRRPSSVSNIGSDNYNYFATGGVNSYLSDYYNGSSTRSISYQASYGFYFSNTAPTTSNNTANSPTITVKTPTISTRCSTTYFSTANAGLIDASNTKITLVADLYRVPLAKSNLRDMYRDAIDLYKAINS